MHSPELEKELRAAAALLRWARAERRISQRQLADAAGLSPAQVNRVERGQDARLSTWLRLFEGLGYGAGLRITLDCDEVVDALCEEQDRRWLRQDEGLCRGKARGQRW